MQIYFYNEVHLRISDISTIFTLSLSHSLPPALPTPPSQFPELIFFNYYCYTHVISVSRYRPSLLSFALVKHSDQNPDRGRIVLIWLIYPDHRSSSREARAGIQSRNLEAGTEAQTIEERCLLACSAHLCTACFPTQPRTTCTAEGIK